MDKSYVDSVDQFVSLIPDSFLRKLADAIKKGHEHEALNLACQYVTKFFSYVTYTDCYHHGHFVYSLLNKAREQV
jgi:hypothetical protein